MKYQGWRSPIVVSKRSGFIVKGHGRLAAARLNQWAKAPVDRQDYATEADEFADMVADNKIAELSETDLKIISQDLASFPELDLELLGSSSIEEEIKNLTLVEEVNSGDENSEWVGLPEFEQAEKEIRLALIFKTELERELFTQKYEIAVTNKHSGQWTARI